MEARAHRGIAAARAPPGFRETEDRAHGTPPRRWGAAAGLQTLDLVRAWQNQPLCATTSFVMPWIISMLSHLDPSKPALPMREITSFGQRPRPSALTVTCCKP